MNWFLSLLFDNLKLTLVQQSNLTKKLKLIWLET